MTDQNRTFDVKRNKISTKNFIPFPQALIVEEPSSEPKEHNPANLVSLKTQTSALRDQIQRIEKEEEWKGSGGSSNARRSSVNSGGSNGSGNAAAASSGQAGGAGGSRSTEKHRKRLAELEAQLVLASPSLLFQVEIDYSRESSAIYFRE